MNHAEYTEKWKVAMQDAYDLARQNISKSADDGKRQYDRKVRFSSLQPGDRVVVLENLGLIGNKKYIS